MSSIIEMTAVGKHFPGRGRTALVDVSLAVSAGECVAVLGPSGSGKSTLLNLLAGLDRSTAGSVVVCGEAVNRLSEPELARFRRRHLGFIFQFFNLLPSLSVLDNGALPARLLGVPIRHARRRGNELLQELGLGDLARDRPALLSGGEQQRVAIARALVNRPRVLLADEPTGALESQAGQQVMEVLAALGQTGQTVVLVTHDARLAASHAHRVLMLRDGRLMGDCVLEPGDHAVGDLVHVREAKS